MKIEINDEFFDEESLKNTPGRIQKFIKEWEEDKNFKFTVFDNEGYNHMIILKTDFESLCSHHLMPFHGTCWIGYIPNEKICGISKLARAVDKFAHRPQLQERLTEQIIDFLDKMLKPKGVMIVMKARHDCMALRGVKKPNSLMTTSAIRGVFEEQTVRQEFLELIKLDGGVNL